MNADRFKAVRTLDSAHEAQLINYLKATNIEVGLLLQNSKDLYMIIKEKISVMISVDRWLSSYNFLNPINKLEMPCRKGFRQKNV